MGLLAALYGGFRDPKVKCYKVMKIKFQNVKKEVTIDVAQVISIDHTGSFSTGTYVFVVSHKLPLWEQNSGSCGSGKG